MARSKSFDIPADLSYFLLNKVFTAQRQGVALSDRNQYANQLSVGEHTKEGTLSFKIAYTIGEDSTAMRSYGVPLDTVILLGFLYTGAFREQLRKAVEIVREIRTAELEERRVRGIRYTFDRVVETEDDYRLEPVTVRIKAMEVAREATRLGMRLIGEYPEFADDPKETKRRQLISAQIANCLGSIKVARPYDGPCNIDDVKFNLITVEEVQQAEAA